MINKDMIIILCILLFAISSIIGLFNLRKDSGLYMISSALFILTIILLNK